MRCSTPSKVVQYSIIHVQSNAATISYKLCVTLADVVDLTGVTEMSSCPLPECPSLNVE